MQVGIIRYGGIWIVQAREGRLMNKEIAVTEAIQLVDATFCSHDGSILGDAKAVWGIQVRPEAYEDARTVLGLGINKRFDARPVTDAFFDAGHWRDSETKRTLLQAKVVFAFGSQVTYWGGLHGRS